MKSIAIFWHAVADLILPYAPFLWEPETVYRYAFLVHPRSIQDVYRKYPIARLLPERFLLPLLRYYWPVTVSRITGLRAALDGRAVEGFILSIPLTARQMVEDRETAKKHIARAVRLGRARGAKIIGLGGLTASVTAGGREVETSGVGIVNGYAYTAHNVTANVLALAQRFKIDRGKVKVAIVGAAGSVGGLSARILARNGFSSFLLIDLPKKRVRFERLREDLIELNTRAAVTLSHSVRDIDGSDIIIAATNAPEALITTEDVKPGAIVVDDAQPSDVAPDVLLRDDVLVIEAGVVHTPGITNNFNLGLKSCHDNFCCMSEVLILASELWRGDHITDATSLDRVEDLGRRGSALGFRVAKLQNFLELIPDAKIKTVQSLIQKNGIQL